MTKNILILYTGGTIGMVRTTQGYAPKPGYLSEILHQHPELQGQDLPRFELKEYAPLIDSSNMKPNDWVRIAQDIQHHYAEYDGFLVLHGTDTMAYTASALDRKSVV